MRHFFAPLFPISCYLLRMHFTLLSDFVFIDRVNNNFQDYSFCKHFEDKHCYYFGDKHCYYFFAHSITIIRRIKEIVTLHTSPTYSLFFLSKSKNHIMSQHFALRKLIVAVENGDLQLIQTWLNACDSTTRNNMNFIDEYYLLLLTAINNNHKEIAKLLIRSGCSMESKHGNVEKLLQRAVINNDIEITTMLLAKKAEGISENFTSSLLNKAVENRSIDMVRLLLSNDADVNYIDHQGMTVLQFLFENLFQDDTAMQINDESIVDIVKLLLSQGASTNFRSINGQTALHYAVRFGQKDVLHTILQKTENVNAISLLNLTPLHLLLTNNETTEENILDTTSLFVLKGARADIPNYQNETACHIAARKKFIRVLHILLLQCQNNINFCDIECCTVLHRILEDSITFSNRDDFNDLVNFMILKEPFCNIKNEHGKTPLHVAVESKQYEILNNMLFRVENLNVPDGNGDTVLHIFLRNLDNNFNFGDSLDIIKNLLTRGSNVDFANKMRQTPIHLAIELKNLKLLSLVLNHSNDLNNIHMAQGWSILHIFSTIQDFIEGDDIKISEVAEMCINKGAIVDLTDVSSQTPLALAVLHKNVAMVKVLLQYGANPNAKFDIHKTVMHNLLLKNSAVDIEIAEALLAHGMEVDKSCLSLDLSDFKNKGGILMTIVEHMKDLTKGNLFGNTMLHSVLQYNKFINNKEEERLCEFVIMLLSKGASIDAKTTLEKTSLHFAVENKHRGVVKILLQHGADPKSLCFSNNSALHLISMQSTDTGTNMDEEIIDVLVEKGCLVNARNTFGMTPLLLAAKSGSTAVVKALIKHKAIVHCTVGTNCDSALHLAALENKWSVIQPIVESGADIHTLRKDGKTALHMAAAHTQSLATRVLLGMGADPDMRDNDGRTALHLACWNNSLDNISCLLVYGADVNVEDNFRTVPVMLAQNSDGLIVEKIIYHLKKLEVMRMYISPLNQHFVRTRPRPAGIVSFEEAINREAKGMSEIMVQKYVPLCDVLQMGPKRIYALKSNKIFQHLMNTAYLKLKFPHVADLIRSRYKKGIIRENFLSIGRVALPKLLGFQLPEVCCNQVFMYLSNENLQKLVVAARLVFGRKRKGSVRVTVVKRAKCATI